MLTEFSQLAVGAANKPGDDAEGKEAYLSRVSASQTNGAGPAADPIRAPWSFDDFALGTRRLRQDSPTKAAGFPVVKVVLILGGIYLIWKFVLKK